MTATENWGAVRAIGCGSTWAAWRYGIIAVLFNPIATFHMKRETWLLIDVITAICLIGVGGIVVFAVARSKAVGDVGRDDTNGQ